MAAVKRSARQLGADRDCAVDVGGDARPELIKLWVCMWTNALSETGAQSGSGSGRSH